MSEAKPTPGPWEAIEKQDADPSEGSHFIRCSIGALGYWRGHKRDHEDCNWILNGPDARLIADAGTVFHTTGLTPSQLVERVKELEEALTLADLLLSGANMNRANVELKVRSALSKARPNTAEGEAHADNVLEDSARWHEVLNHVGADNLLGGAQYVLRGIQAPVNVMQGSVAQHFTKSIDAARKQAAAKEPSP